MGYWRVGAALWFIILNTDTVLIEAQIPEVDLGRLGSSRGATYQASDAPGTFVPILGHGGGRLVYLWTSVDPKTRTVALVYEVPNPNGRLRIGIELTVYVETAHVEEAVVVPVAALVDEDGRAVAFVQVSGETFEKRDLTLGIRDAVFRGAMERLSPILMTALAAGLALIPWSSAERSPETRFKRPWPSSSCSDC